MIDDQARGVVRWLAAAHLVLGCSLGSAGCVLVQPHQREHLSMPEMTPTADALEDTFHAHIEAARRAATNGHGGGGGGCGCG